MKTVREISDVDGLLNAVLADDDWDTLNCSLKCEALAALTAASRRRRVRRWVGQAACAIVFLAAAGWWLRSPAPGRPPVAETSRQHALPGVEDRLITENQMLAMFPAGSCVVAEVNGQKELVFFDPRKAEEGFVLGAGPARPLPPVESLDP